MTSSAPLYKRLLKLAAITFLTTSAFAQATPKYDTATEGTFKGIVEELKIVPPTGGKPVAYLVMKSGQDPAIQVFLCPKKFLDDMGVVFKAEDQIEVTGSKIKQARLVINSCGDSRLGCPAIAKPSGRRNQPIPDHRANRAS
jgi:hypothetical protein